MLWLYTKFEFSTMPGTGQKVCVVGGGVVVWCGGVVFMPILVFSLAKAEQKRLKRLWILFDMAYCSALAKLNTKIVLHTHPPTHNHHHHPPQTF